MEKQLKYLVLGAGGTGGPIGGYLARAGKDVTLIARGRHLEAMKSNGLEIELGDESLFHGSISGNAGRDLCMCKRLFP